MKTFATAATVLGAFLTLAGAAQAQTPQRQPTHDQRVQQASEARARKNAATGVYARAYDRRQTVKAAEEARQKRHAAAVQRASIARKRVNEANGTYRRAYLKRTAAARRPG